MTVPPSSMPTLSTIAPEAQANGRRTSLLSTSFGTASPSATTASAETCPCGASTSVMRGIPCSLMKPSSSLGQDMRLGECSGEPICTPDGAANKPMPAHFRTASFRAQSRALASRRCEPSKCETDLASCGWSAERSKPSNETRSSRSTSIPTGPQSVMTATTSDPTWDRLRNIEDSPRSSGCPWSPNALQTGHQRFRGTSEGSWPRCRAARMRISAVPATCDSRLNRPRTAPLAVSRSAEVRVRPNDSRRCATVAQVISSTLTTVRAENGDCPMCRWKQELSAACSEGRRQGR